MLVSNANGRANWVVVRSNVYRVFGVNLKSWAIVQLATLHLKAIRISVEHTLVFNIGVEVYRHFLSNFLVLGKTVELHVDTESGQSLLDNHTDSGVALNLVLLLFGRLTNKINDELLADIALVDFNMRGSRVNVTVILVENWSENVSAVHLIVDLGGHVLVVSRPVPQRQTHFVSSTASDLLEPNDIVFDLFELQFQAFTLNFVVLGLADAAGFNQVVLFVKLHASKANFTATNCLFNVHYAIVNSFVGVELLLLHVANHVGFCIDPLVVCRVKG